MNSVFGTDNFELVYADLLDEATLISAFEGCEYVIHVATKVSVDKPKDENEVLGPAVEGTEKVINACYHNNVKRLILTSSAS